MRRVAVMLCVAGGCRVGVSPGGVYRLGDHQTAAALQVEAGAYVDKQSGVFVVANTMQSRGETEGHLGWVWYLLEGRYRHVITRWEKSQLYVAGGAGFGAGNRDGVAFGTHAEVGIEYGTRRTSVDVSLRQCLMRVPDGNRHMDVAALLFAITVGTSTLQ